MSERNPNMTFPAAEIHHAKIPCTTDKSAMRKIPKIDPEHVELYGDKFLALIDKAHQHYRSMMGEDDRPHDPNHQNVVTISSDDDEEDSAEDLDLRDVNSEGSEDAQEETSGYFVQSQEVRAFNDQS